jgi:hypothetical protein
METDAALAIAAASFFELVISTKEKLKKDIAESAAEGNAQNKIQKQDYYFITF